MSYWPELGTDWVIERISSKDHYASTIRPISLAMIAYVNSIVFVCNALSLIQTQDCKVQQFIRRFLAELATHKSKNLNSALKMSTNRIGLKSDPFDLARQTRSCIQIWNASTEMQRDSFECNQIDRIIVQFKTLSALQPTWILVFVRTGPY